MFGRNPIWYTDSGALSNLVNVWCRDVRCLQIRRRVVSVTVPVKS